MHEEIYRVIPGYDAYGVSRNGVIISLERQIILSQHDLAGYKIVDTFRGSLTETLPVHRAVALAWVHNPDPERFNVVNHIDGNPVNNWWENLEWTDYSGNNYHAVNNGLRNDNIRCLVRDFDTGMIYPFSSMAQAACFMGLRPDASFDALRPKMFGSLISNRYEFRFENDPTPWFYEGRSRLDHPTRFMVTARHSDGSVKEFYSVKDLQNSYGLHGLPSKSTREIVEYGNYIYSETQFQLRDSYAEDRFRQSRATKISRRIGVECRRQNEVLKFSSLTECSNYFNVDRSSVQNRLDNSKQLDGWTFTTCLTGQQ